MRQNVKTHSGNRIAIELDGREVGLIQSVRANDSYGLEDASGVGDIHVQEHVPSKAVHTLSISTMVLKKKNLRDTGIAPQNGDDVLAGLIFDVCIYDKDDGSLLRKYIGCSYDSGDVEVSAHRITMASGQLKALDVVGTGL